MTKKQFKHDFLRGLGSALLELKTCENPQRYYDIVHYGCLHNTTYDMQCEGDRGWYLHQAAVIVGGDTILKDVIERYARGFSDVWLYNQLTGILYHFAVDGNESARAALYRQYENMIKELSPRKRKHIGAYPRRDMFDWLCVWMTSLDGWSAFKQIVNDISEKLLPKDSNLFFSEWFYDNSKHKFGKKRVEGYLQKQAKKSELIKMYWDKAQAWDHYLHEKPPEPTLEDVIAGVDGERFHGRGLSMRFVRNASQDDLDKLLRIAMAEQNLQKRAELLWGLRKAAAPIPEDFVSKLLQSENEDIRNTAFYIMENNPY